MLAWVCGEIAFHPAAAAPSGLVGHIARSVSGLLETRFARAHLSGGRRISGIILLGGGTDRAPAFIALARRHPGVRLIISGASQEEIDAVAEANLAPNRITVDSRPANTYENALFSKLLAAPKHGERWLIVTSATHMPRAMGAFRSTGFQVEPWPVADTPKDMRRLLKTIRREIAGLVAYRLLGHTHELLPGPLASGSAADAGADAGRES